MDGRRSEHGEENLHKQKYNKQLLLFFVTYTVKKLVGLMNYSVCICTDLEQSYYAMSSI